MTKKQQYLLANYLWHLSKHPCRTLYDAYKNPSQFKIQAYDKIRSECYAENGYDLTVLGANSSFFSVAYKRPNPDTGVIELVYHTHANKYVFEI